jgi:hypothetical protein
MRYEPKRKECDEDDVICNLYCTCVPQSYTRVHTTTIRTLFATQVIVPNFNSWSQILWSGVHVFDVGVVFG